MQIRLIALTLAMALPFLAGTANAQPATESGRFTMHKTDNGFIRLDTRTGEVSLCRQKDDDAWACSPMTDEARALRQENEQLREENRELSERLRLRQGPTGEPPFRNGAPRSWRREEAPPKPTFRLPSEKEVDKALDYFENMLRKFQERLKRLEKDKSEGPGNKEL